LPNIFKTYHATVLLQRKHGSEVTTEERGLEATTGSLIHITLLRGLRRNRVEGNFVYGKDTKREG
jgi:hypothetical protein